MSADSLARASGLSSPTLDDERYQVRSRLEILSILRNVCDKNEFATVYFGQGADFVVSMVLAVRPEAGEVVLDFGADALTNDRLMHAERLLVASQLAGIRVQFATGKPQPVQFEGAPAFRVAIPAEIMRLQRREYYRVRVPGSRTVKCEVPSGEDGRGRVGVRVFDLSSGGIGLADLPQSLRCEAGLVWPGCRLALPEVGALTVDLAVARVIDAKTPAGGVTRRAGAQFLKLNDGMRAQLQRFINRIEREQLAR